MRSLLEEYHRYAVEHGKQTLESNSDAANAACDGIQKTFLAIVKDGKANDLFCFYDDADFWVQSWAAFHTLKVDELKALKKLEQLESAGIPHVSTDAKFTILEWKNGNLR